MRSPRPKILGRSLPLFVSRSVAFRAPREEDEHGAWRGGAGRRSGSAGASLCELPLPTRRPIPFRGTLPGLERAAPQASVNGQITQYARSFRIFARLEDTPESARGGRCRTARRVGGRRTRLDGLLELGGLLRGLHLPGALGLAAVGPDP